MPITDLLRRNAIEHPQDVALVELNPSIPAKSLTTWKEYELMQPTSSGPYRKEIQHEP